MEEDTSKAGNEGKKKAFLPSVTEMLQLMEVYPQYNSLLHAAFGEKKEELITAILDGTLDGAPERPQDMRQVLCCGLKNGFFALSWKYFRQIRHHLHPLNINQFVIPFGCSLEAWKFFLNYVDRVVQFYYTNWCDMILIAAELGLEHFQLLIHHENYRENIFPDIYEVAVFNPAKLDHQYATLFEKRLGCPVYVDCLTATRDFYRQRYLWQDYLYTLLVYLKEGLIFLDDSELHNLEAFLQNRSRKPERVYPRTYNMLILSELSVSAMQRMLRFFKICLFLDETELFRPICKAIYQASNVSLVPDIAPLWKTRLFS